MGTQGRAEPATLGWRVTVPSRPVRNDTSGELVRLCPPHSWPLSWAAMPFPLRHGPLGAAASVQEPLVPGSQGASPCVLGGDLVSLE